MKYTRYLVSCLSPASTATICGRQREGTMKEHRILFHIDEMEKWKLLLANVKNLVHAAAPEKVTIEVVANAAAVAYYVKTTGHPEMDELAASGVLFCACNNALRGLNLDSADLTGYVKVVSAGVKELMERQEDGYGYIKP
jgi:uncharacterized protein